MVICAILDQKQLNNYLTKRGISNIRYLTDKHTGQFAKRSENHMLVCFGRGIDVWHIPADSDLKANSLPVQFSC